MSLVDDVLAGAPLGDTLPLAERWTIRSRPGTSVADVNESLGVYDEHNVGRGMYSYAAGGANHGITEGQRRGFLASMLLAMEVVPHEIEDMACGGEY